MSSRKGRRSWRFRLNEDTILEVTARGATEKQVRRRGRVSLVLGTLVAAAILVGAASATVWTDKADYAYGETVQIAGDGMTAGEAVSVDVTFPDGSLAQNHVVQADENGNFSDSFDVVEGMPAGIYGVKATGQTSGTEFTTEFDPANPDYGAEYDPTTPVDPASQQYSDKIAFKGTFTCEDAPSGACPTTDLTPTVTIQLKGTGIGDGNTWTNVQVTTVAAFHFTTTSPGCSTACSVPWSIEWQVGRLADGTTSVPPGTYSYRASVSGLGNGTIQVGGTGTGLTDAVTVTKESTTTTYNGDTTGGTSTPLSVSALVADQDGGSTPPSTNGIFSPDTYLAGSAVVDFTLYSNPGMTTAVATDTPDTDIINTGATTGSPTVTLPATPGTYYMKTTYAGNTYYFGSFDGPDNILVTSTEIQVCKAAPAIAADYLKQLNLKKKIKNSDNIVQLIADEMAKLTRAQFPTYTNATSSTGSPPLLRPCENQAAYKTSVEFKTQYWIDTLLR